MKILKEVLSKTFPDDKEWEEVKKVSREVILVSLRICSEGPFKNGFPRPHLVGSAIRRTFIKGDHDIDLFLVYPRESSEEEAIEDFKERGKKIFHSLEASYEMKYAQHPYYRGKLSRNGKDFLLEIVPSFEFKRGEKVKSPVDRSIEHDRFVKRKITEMKGLEKEIVLLKAFFKGIGVYGAESYVGGFSGYLTELIAIYYGSFLKALNGISGWRPYSVLLHFGNNEIWKGGESPLVFVDPVDGRRNVAAALREEKMRIAILAAREFLENPSINFFFPKDPPPLSDDEIEELKREFFLVKFPEDFTRVHEEIRYGELSRTAKGISSCLKLEKIDINEYLVLWRENSILFKFSDKREGIERRYGPPVKKEFEKHIRRFLSKWKTDPRYIRDGIEDGRIYVEIRKEIKPLRSVISYCLKKCKKGKDLCKYVERGEYEILMGDPLISFLRKNRDTEREVKLFLCKIPPWRL